MYEFVDQPVTALNRGGRVLVWAMRSWARAAVAGRCPCSDIGPAFEQWGLMAGFPHFQVMMAMLARGARAQLRFCSVDCGWVNEDEAVILSLFCTLRNEPASRLNDTLKLVVDDDAHGPLLIAMSALGRALAERDVYPASPVHDSECSPFRRG